MTLDESGLSVSETERQEISAFEKELREAGWARHVTLLREIAIWQRLAAGLHEYRLTIDDYTNDLYSREYLKRALERLGEPLRSRLRARVEASDDAFRSASEPDSEGAARTVPSDRRSPTLVVARIPAAGPLSEYVRSTQS